MTDTREQFEQHFKLTIRQKARNKLGIYSDPLTRAGWDGWQAREQFLTVQEPKPAAKAERLAELQREIADLMAYDEHTDHLPAPLNGHSERDALAERIREEIKQLGGTF